MSRDPERCEWIDLTEALREFAVATYGTASQRHIRPLHWYMACRLCLEGGFDPDEIWGGRFGIGLGRLTIVKLPRPQGGASR